MVEKINSFSPKSAEAEILELATVLSTEGPNNGVERTLCSSNGDEEKAHTREPEKVIEWGGPNLRYGKVGGRFQLQYVLTTAIMRDIVECNYGKGSLQSGVESD